MKTRFLLKTSLSATFQRHRRLSLRDLICMLVHFSTVADLGGQGGHAPPPRPCENKS